MTILLLITKIFVCSGILFGYYWVFLRNKKFHHYNRFYLLAITILSLAIPFIKIPIFFEASDPGNQIVYKSIDLISVNNWEEEFIESEQSVFQSWLTIQNGLYVLYGIGILILLLILLKTLFYIKKIARKYPHERIEKLKFYNTEEPGTPFSFFQSVFWNRNLNFNSKEGQQIFRHELFHVKQHHSADILFLEFASIVFWINPFFHLIKKELKAIHEFLADQYAVSNNNQYEYAELLVMQSINAKKISITNYFFQNHIKRRIAMITQFKNKNYSYWSRVMILPVLVILFCAFVLRTQQSPTFSSANSVTDNEKSITILIDAGHGGEDAGARSNDGKFLEKDLALAIALKVKKHAAEYKNLNIVMTREADEYPKIKDRAEMAAIVKADMVISIHVSVQGPKSDNEYASDQKSGFEAYITGKEHQHKETSRKIAESILKNVAGIYATTPIIKQRSQGGIWMLDAVPCASVLIECGYMTNEKDLAFIIQPQNQEKVARHIIEGIVNYYATNDYSNNFSGNGTDTLPSPNNNKNINQNKNKQTHELSDAEIQALKMQQQELNKQFELLLAKQKELQLLQQNANAAQLEDLKRNELNIQKKLEVLVEKEHEFTRKEQNKKQEVVEKELAIQRQHQENIKQQQMEFELQQHHMQQAQLQEQKNHERMMQFEKEQRLMLEKQQELQALQQRLQEQQRMEELKKQQFLNEQMNQNKQQNGYQSDNQDSIPEGVTFTKVENPPSFPGGDKAWKKYVTKQIKYPVEAIEKGLSGTVIVQFIVEKNGELTEIETINNKGNALAAESIRVIKESGKWIPATQNGHIVRAYHKQPIVFKLSRG